MDAWCWDARPYPDFPGRTAIWADGGNWRTGHWLNGRLHGEAADLIAAIASRAGVGLEDLDLSEVEGVLEGYLIDRPMTASAALAPLLLALGLDAAERGGRLAFVRRGDERSLSEADLALPERGAPDETARRVEPAPGAASVRFIDGAADYAIGAVSARTDGANGEAIHLDLPIVTGEGLAEAVAHTALARAGAHRVERRLHLAPLAGLGLEAGDLVVPPGEADRWRVLRLDHGETCRAVIAPETGAVVAAGDERWRPGDPTPIPGAPWLRLLDLPGRGDDDRLLAAAAGRPWRPLDLHLGVDAESLTVRARIETPATPGVLIEPLAPGSAGRWDRTNTLALRIEGRAPQSASAAAVLNGANRVAVQAADGGWELIQFQTADLVGTDHWRLWGLLRGQDGTEIQAALGAAAGATAVLLDEPLTAVPMTEAERGLSLIARAAAAGTPAGGAASTQAALTWRGLSLRPWSPAHLRAASMDDGAIQISWIRRARTSGDSWDLEPPLGEEREVYRVEILADGVAVAAYEAATTTLVWSVAEQARVLSGLSPSALRIRVAQGSAIWGWGVAATLDV